MSSLFDQLSGFEFPDVLMNSGPLPSTAGGPAGSDGSVDGVINGTSALLENISPYALGKSARTGSDRNYQQIPHRFQYIVPRLYIPHFDTERRIHISHAVDQGDIAFLLYGGERAWLTTDKQFGTRAPPCAFATIEVVNYILLCMQASGTKDWGLIRNDLIKDEQFKAAMERRTKQQSQEYDNLRIFKAIRLLIQQVFVPHGICAGSEHQGGQHEHTGGHPVQAAVNFVTTMTVDGKNVDLVNYWYGLSMKAGDELIFRLENQEIQESKEFQLSRYYKEPVCVTVNPYSRLDPNNLPQTMQKTYWQLVPDIMRKTPVQTTAVFDATKWWCDHHCEGYWRIAQTFQMRAQNNSSNAFTRGLPLEVTFAPVFQSFIDCEYDRVEHPKFTHYVDHYDAQKKLKATFTQDKLSWTYQGTEAFSLEAKNNGYELISDKQLCRVHLLSTKVNTPCNVKSLSHIICFFSENIDSVDQTVEASGSNVKEMHLADYNPTEGKVTYESFPIPKDQAITSPDFYLRIVFETTHQRSFMDVGRPTDLLRFDGNLWIENDKSYKIREKLEVDYSLSAVPMSTGNQGGQPSQAPVQQGNGGNAANAQNGTDVPQIVGGGAQPPPATQVVDAEAGGAALVSGGAGGDAGVDDAAGVQNVDGGGGGGAGAVDALGNGANAQMTTDAMPTAAALGLLPQKKRKTLKIFDDIL
jgi:hypothetical protein